MRFLMLAAATMMFASPSLAKKRKKKVLGKMIQVQVGLGLANTAETKDTKVEGTSFSDSDSSEDLDSAFGITAAVDVPLGMPNLRVGGRLGVFMGKYEKNKAETEISVYDIGGQARYFTGSALKGKLFPFGLAAVGLSIGNFKPEEGDEYKGNGYHFAIGGGAEYAISKAVSGIVTITYNYRSMAMEGDGDQKVEFDGLVNGLMLNVGAAF